MDFEDEAKCKKIWCCFSVLKVFAIIYLIILFIIATFAARYAENVNILYIDIQRPSPYRTSSKFLSIALDSSVIADGFLNFNTTDVKLITLIKYFSPAYLRIGGTAADRLKFSLDVEEPNSSILNFYRNAMYFQKSTDINFPSFMMTGFQWLQLMTLARKCSLDVLFDLNALMRFQNGSWDYRNAEALIKFSNDHHLKVSWELGNEPDSFYHIFNEAINATQMAKDFAVLKNILGKYPMYRTSLLVGPDITRPRNDRRKSKMYLKEFLTHAADIVDAVTWHQYYLNGRTATAEEFLDPEVFDCLKKEIDIIKNIVNSKNVGNKLIWLAYEYATYLSHWVIGETSSAYGGGARNLSDSFIGSFIWVDKLGLAAKMGIDVVCRQSIFKGYYALIDNGYDPNPDWWISIIYKKFIGQNVVPCYTMSSPKVRLYCHCTKRNVFKGNAPSVTVFGINLDNITASIRIEGLFPLSYETKKGLFSSIYAYEVTGHKSLFSRDIDLNGIHLTLSKDNMSLPEFVPNIIKTDGNSPLVTMPPYSIVFWVIPNLYIKACPGTYG